MGVLLGVVAKAVVKSGVGRFQLDIIDQFAALGSGQRWRGELPAAAFREQQILYVGGIVSCQSQGARNGGEYLGPPVDFG
jgi:hypothetical protein